MRTHTASGINDSNVSQRELLETLDKGEIQRRKKDHGQRATNKKNHLRDAGKRNSSHSHDKRESTFKKRKLAFNEHGVIAERDDIL